MRRRAEAIQTDLCRAHRDLLFSTTIVRVGLTSLHRIPRQQIVLPNTEDTVNSSNSRNRYFRQPCYPRALIPRGRDYDKVNMYDAHRYPILTSTRQAPMTQILSRRHQLTLNLKLILGITLTSIQYR